MPSSHLNRTRYVDGDEKWDNVSFLDPRITGTHHGYFDKFHSIPENEAMIEQMAQHPLQERWLMENWAPSGRRRIDANVALTYVSGDT